MRARLATLSLGLSVGAALAPLACDVDASERSAQPSLTATFDRSAVFHTDGSVDLEATVVLTLRSDHLERGYDLGGARLVEPDGVHAWESVEVESDGPWPMFLAAGGRIAQRVVTVRARVPVESAKETSTLPALSPSTLELTVRGAGLDEGDSQVVVPILDQDARVQDACGPPDLQGVAAPLGVAMDWSAATLPGLVADVTALSADPLGRAYFVGTYPRPSGSFHSRVFAAKGGLVQTIMELPSPLVAIAPGEGSGPTVALHDLPAEGTDETDGVVVSRHDANLVELWSRRVESTGGLLAPAVATSGGRVLVGLNATVPLTVGGVEVAGADPSAYQVLLFDAETGALLASKGGLDVTSAAGLADGAFGIVDAAGFVRVLEADLSERWSVEDAVSIAASGDHLWTLGELGARAYDAAGNQVSYVSSARTPTRVFRDKNPTFAPLPDGSVLIETPNGLARATLDGQFTEASLPYAKVGWCSARPAFLVAPAPGGAVIAGRPETPQDGASPGRGAVARIALLP